MLVLIDLSVAFDTLIIIYCYRDWNVSLGLDRKHETRLDHINQIDTSLLISMMFPPVSMPCRCVLEPASVGL